MIGELYNTSYGWTIMYPNEKKNHFFNRILLPLTNETILNDEQNGDMVSFDIVFNYDDDYKDLMPFAQIKN